MVNNIAVLPKGTFSDLAAQEFLKKNPQISANISYHETIPNVFKDLDAENSQFAVVPIENTLAGFEETTKKGLDNFSIEIIDEITLPIQFSFLSNVEHSKIKKIFAHNMAKKQCLKFLSKFSPEQIIYADSNIDSFEKLNESTDNAAIVPIHIFEENAENYKFSLKNITDSPDNNTRFLVLRKIK